MPRRTRINSATGIHHVVNRGVNRQRIFFGDEGHIEFEQRLQIMYERFQIQTLAYCLLDNHFHMLMRAELEAMSTAMQQAMGSFVRHTNDRLGRDGPMFSGRFWSDPIQSERHFLTASRYIHRNAYDVAPRAPLAEYRWSSYPAILGLRPAPEFLDVDTLLGLFNFDRAELTRFTEVDTEVLGFFPITADDVRGVVAGAVVTVLASNDLADDRQRGLERTVTVLLLDHPLGADALAAVRTVVAFPSEGAERVASALTMNVGGARPPL